MAFIPRAAVRLGFQAAFAHPSTVSAFTTSTSQQKRKASVGGVFAGGLHAHAYSHALNPFLHHPFFQSTKSNRKFSAAVCEEDECSEERSRTQLLEMIDSELGKITSELSLAGEEFRGTVPFETEFDSAGRMIFSREEKNHSIKIHVRFMSESGEEEEGEEEDSVDDADMAASLDGAPRADTAAADAAGGRAGTAAATPAAETATEEADEADRACAPLVARFEAEVILPAKQTTLHICGAVRSNARLYVESLEFPGRVLHFATLPPDQQAAMCLYLDALGLSHKTARYILFMRDKRSGDSSIDSLLLLKRYVEGRRVEGCVQAAE